MVAAVTETLNLFSRIALDKALSNEFARSAGRRKEEAKEDKEEEKDEENKEEKERRRKSNNSNRITLNARK